MDEFSIFCSKLSIFRKVNAIFMKSKQMSEHSSIVVCFFIFSSLFSTSLSINDSFSFSDKALVFQQMFYRQISLKGNRSNCSDRDFPEYVACTNSNLASDEFENDRDRAKRVMEVSCYNETAIKRSAP